ncbi:hypothetical protein DA803_02925 [[Mycoplasma] phocae]|uniref:Lipoprotein n=1 Tax=[Mycoplasma] phocae TaxID=142651 RepID=A0A2Z5IQV7_9BACT|nr:hypothetical protein [[Mycoplasma] phocae]AXE61022.1 hypothetical protein DA803_02925 [[Mycoplasma] phocae]
MKKKNFKWWIALPSVVAILPLIAASCGKKDNGSQGGSDQEMMKKPNKPDDSMNNNDQGMNKKPDNMDKDNGKQSEKNQDMKKLLPDGMNENNKKDMNNGNKKPDTDKQGDNSKQEMKPSPDDMDKNQNDNKEMKDPNKKDQDNMSKDKIDDEKTLEFKRKIWYSNLYFLAYQSFVDVYEKSGGSDTKYETYQFENEAFFILNEIKDDKNKEYIDNGKKFIQDFIEYKSNQNSEFKKNLENVIVAGAPSGIYAKFLVFIENKNREFSELNKANPNDNNYRIYFFIGIWDLMNEIKDEKFYKYTNLFQAKYQLEQYLKKMSDQNIKNKSQNILNKLNETIGKKGSLSKQDIEDINKEVDEIKKILNIQ